MYRNHWNLDRRPFDDGALPEFYFPGHAHESALLKIRYLIEQRRGVGVIAGEHGLGKTYLTHVLEAELADEGYSPFVRLVFPQLSPAGTLAYLARRLGAEIPLTVSDAEILFCLEERLAQLLIAGRHTVFIVDDAHLLDVAHLNSLRLLLNLREEGVADFSMLFLGRTEVLARLQQVAALDQRIGVKAGLEPLAPHEVMPYLNRRLEQSGCNKPIFTPGAADSIWQITQGIPRRINQICDLTLLVGYVDRCQSIDSADVEAAAEELTSVAA